MDEHPFEPWEQAIFDAVEQRPDATLDEVKGALVSLVDAATKETLAGLRRDESAMLIEQAAIRSEFEVSLRDPWGPAFDRLELLLVSAREALEIFIEHHRPEANAVEPEGDTLFYALTRLHARACRVTSEILALLRSGHPRGALARWRTLHEIGVTMAFLNQHGRPLAEAYLLHNAVASYKSLLGFQRYAARLGNTPFSDEEAAAIKAERDQLIDRYGKAFDSPYGWASLILPGEPNFAEIEAVTNLDHWRPYVAWASQSIHAGPKGVIVERVLDGGVEVLMAGPQSEDLADPGSYASSALALATVELLSSRTTFDGVVQMNVLRTLAGDAAQAFMEAQEKAERDSSDGESESAPEP